MTNTLQYHFPHIYINQQLFAKNGEAVIVKKIIDNQTIIVEYKGKYYKRDIAACYNITLFPVPYNEESRYFNVYGYDQNGFDKNGYNAEGYDQYGFSHSGYDKDGYDHDGLNKKGTTRQGTTWMDIAEQLDPGKREMIFGHLCDNKGIIKKCRDCHKEFKLTFDQLTWYIDNNLSIPRRCVKCRNAKKQEQANGIYEGLRESMKRDDISIVRTGREQAYSNYLEYDL